MSSLANDDRTDQRALSASRPASSWEKPEGKGAAIRSARTRSNFASASSLILSGSASEGAIARNSSSVITNPAGVPSPAAASRASERALPPSRASVPCRSAKKLIARTLARIGWLSSPP